MTATLPGGLWYPERHTLRTYGDPVTPAVVDAAGDVFSFTGAVRCGGAAVQVRVPGPIRLELLDPAAAVLRARDWSPGPTTSPTGTAEFVLWVEWLTDVELAAGTAYRLIVTNLSGAAVRLRQRTHAPTDAGLGHKVTRVGGVWAEDATRRVAMALKVTGC